jgi:transposase-like protein
MVRFKGTHFERDIILTCVRWYLAYPLSYRQLEELMQERGVSVDHATINRWVLKYSPLLEEAFHHRKRPVWVSWRMDETYIRVKGQWRYLYRGVSANLLYGFERFIVQSDRRASSTEPTIQGSVNPRRYTRGSFTSRQLSCVQKVQLHASAGA